MKSRSFAKVLVGASVFASMLPLAACGAKQTAGPSSNPSSSAVSAASSDGNGNGNGTGSQNSEGKSIDLRQPGSAASLTYQVNSGEDGTYPTGIVKFTVGDWTTTTDKMVGTVYPVVKEGNYSATMTYTNSSGTSVSKSIHFSVVPMPVRIEAVKATGPLGGWTATWKVVGNPIIEGNVSMVDTTTDKSFGTAVVKDNMVSFPVPAVSKATNTNVQLTYTRLDGTGKISGYFTLVSDPAYTS